MKRVSLKLFSENEVRELSQNLYVKNISTKGITYTDEFKRIFITENESGKFPREIFEARGFDIDILGMSRIHAAGNRWRAAYKENGICGLRDTRAGNSGRPREKDLSIEEKFARLQAQNHLLKAENELLKKIDLAERRMIRKK